MHLLSSRMLNVVTCRFNEGRWKNGEISGDSANDDDDDDDDDEDEDEDEDADVSENRMERRACLGSLGCTCNHRMCRKFDLVLRVVNHFPYS